MLVVAAALAATWALTSAAVDQMRRRPIGLIRPGIAAIGLAFAALLVARRGSLWLAALAGLNLMFALALLVIVRRKAMPPKDPPGGL